MKKFRVEWEIESANGHQVYEVSAENIEAARNLFKDGDSTFVEEELNAESLVDFELCEIYEVS